MSPPTLESVSASPIVTKRRETSFREAIGNFYDEGKLDLSIGLVVAGAALLYGLGVQYLHNVSTIDRLRKERVEYSQSR